MIYITVVWGNIGRIMKRFAVYEQCQGPQEAEILNEGRSKFQLFIDVFKTYCTSPPAEI